MRGRSYASVTLILMGLCAAPLAAQEAPLNEPDPEAPGVGVPFEPDSEPFGEAVPDAAAPAPEFEDGDDDGSPSPADEAPAAPDAADPVAPVQAEPGSPDVAGEPAPEDADPEATAPPDGTDDPATPDVAEDDDPAERDAAEETAQVPGDSAPGDAGPPLAEDGPTEDPAGAPEADPEQADAAEDPDPTAPPADVTGETRAPERPDTPDPETDKLLGYVADALIELQDLREELDILRADLDKLTGEVGRHALLLRQICTDEGYAAADPLCDLQSPEADTPDGLAALEGNVAALEAQVEELLRRLEAQQQGAEEAEPATQLAEIQPAAPAEPFSIRRDGQGRPLFPARRELQVETEDLPDAASCADGGAWLEANVPDRIDNAFFVTDDGGLRRCLLIGGAWEAVFTGRLDKAHVVVEGAAR